MNDRLKDESREQEANSQVPTPKERLNRLVKLAEPRETDSISHDAPTETGFVSGVVHVVLKQGFDAGRLAKRLMDGEDSEEFGPDLPVLRDFLNQHGLKHAEATFDFTPPGLEKETNPPPGRERYVTLYFSPQENTSFISQKLNETSIVDRATPAPKIIPSNSPLEEPMVNSTIMGQAPQWYIKRCKVDSGWQLKGPQEFFSGQGVIIADLDWGFLTSHQEFVDRIETRYNAMTGSTFVNNPTAPIHHGTAALALLGAGANGVGMCGIAFGADLWAIQADNGKDHGRIPPFRFWCFALDYVRRTASGGRRKVICLECETGEHCNVESDAAVNQAIRDAIAEGVVVCVPAGNGNRDAGLDEACNPIPETGSILVGATLFDADDTVNRRAGFSNWGSRVVVSAPGDPNNDITAFSGADDAYLNFGGTSGATPKVAGAAALMLEANPQLHHAEIRDILKATGTPITDPGTKPIGTFLNVEGAIAAARKLLVAPMPMLPGSARINSPKGRTKNAGSVTRSRTIAPSGR
jgi:subtilase family protein